MQGPVTGISVEYWGAMRMSSIRGELAGHPLRLRPSSMAFVAAAISDGVSHLAKTTKEVAAIDTVVVMVEVAVVVAVVMQFQIRRRKNQPFVPAPDLNVMVRCTLGFELLSEHAPVGSSETLANFGPGKVKPAQAVPCTSWQRAAHFAIVAFSRRSISPPSAEVRVSLSK